MSVTSINTPIAPAGASSPPDLSGVEFGISADGFPVACIGDTLLAMVPGDAGTFLLASAWRITRPIAELRREHFYGHDGRLDDEAAFRHRVIETAEHMRELSALARVRIRMSASTPWGASQLATIYADGIVSHATAGHGGFHLSSDRNRQVDAAVRSAGGWYEEDAEWAIVALTFPELFTSYECRCADDTVRSIWPDLWEKVHGRELVPGESWARDREAFDRAHVSDWVVDSAIHSVHHAEMTEVIATKGGRRDGRSGERRFLIPRPEYAARGLYGFVIEPDRHRAYEGPSSFAGWQGRAA